MLKQCSSDHYFISGTFAMSYQEPQTFWRREKSGDNFMSLGSSGNSNLPILGMSFSSTWGERTGVGRKKKCSLYRCERWLGTGLKSKSFRCRSHKKGCPSFYGDGRRAWSPTGAGREPQRAPRGGLRAVCASPMQLFPPPAGARTK